MNFGHASGRTAARPSTSMCSCLPDRTSTCTNRCSSADPGEIVGKALLPNGDAHVFVLIPKDDDGDAEVAGEATATQSDAAPAAQKTASAGRATLTAETMAALRARLGLRSPKKAN